MSFKQTIRLLLIVGMQLFRNISFPSFIIILVLSCTAQLYATPVQWKIADGGNGHWYDYINETLTWYQAKDAAELQNGYLLTITSQEEEDWVLAQFGNSFHPLLTSWLGGYQDTSDPNYSEPLGGWKWVTGEEWSYTNWDSTQPDNYQGWEQNFLHYNSYGDTWTWYDIQEDHARYYIIEWDPVVPEPVTIILFGCGLLGIVPKYLRGNF